MTHLDPTHSKTLARFLKTDVIDDDEQTQVVDSALALGKQEATILVAFNPYTMTPATSEKPAWVSFCVVLACFDVEKTRSMLLNCNSDIAFAFQATVQTADVFMALECARSALKSAGFPRVSYTRCHRCHDPEQCSTIVEQAIAVLIQKHQRLKLEQAGA